MTVTLARAESDHGRGLSRDPDFHRRAHARFRELVASIPADAVFDSSRQRPDDIAASVASRLGVR